MEHEKSVTVTITKPTGNNASGMDLRKDRLRTVTHTTTKYESKNIYFVLRNKLTVGQWIHLNLQKKKSKNLENSEFHIDESLR